MRLPMPAAMRLCGRLARQLRRLRYRYGRQWAAQPLPIVVANVRVVAEPRASTGARRMASLNRLEIYTAWSVCTAVCKVLCKDAHQIRAAVGAPAGARVVRTAAVCLDAELAAADSGCNKNAHLMCKRSNYGLSGLQREVMELWRRSGDGLALGTDAPLAIERRPRVPVCPSVGGNLGELSAGDLPQQDFRGVRGCTSTSRAFYIQVAVPMRLPDAGRLMGSNLLEDGFRTVTFFLKVSPQ